MRGIVAAAAFAALALVFPGTRADCDFNLINVTNTNVQPQSTHLNQTGAASAAVVSDPHREIAALTEQMWALSRAMRFTDAAAVKAAVDEFKLCRANSTVPPGSLCLFNLSGYVCPSIQCNGAAWNQTQVTCEQIPCPDDDVAEYGGIAVALVVTPALVITIVIAVLRFRERAAQTWQ